MARVLKSQTVRQRALAGAKPKRLKKPSSQKRSIMSFLKKEYYLPLPDTSLGRFLNQRRYFLPKFVRDSATEMKEVTWPSRLETRQLAIAVFLFALVFGLVAALVDYGLDKLFKRLLLR